MRQLSKEWSISTTNRRGSGCLARVKTDAERGNAIVELTAVLMVFALTAAVAIVTTSDLLAHRSAVVAAARDASRAFVRAESVELGRDRATELAAQSLRERGLPPPQVVISCSAVPCLTPGAEVTVTVHAEVPLPVFGNRVEITAASTMPVDELRRQRE
ncbi:hypothetical protein [Actinobaculum sp. 352]|uniref:TadE/TadG family type IV pilus assembly protein n=1 Tax=Actinobaculum sp. 352 TaxID=2490946 RepID=UPI000F7FA93B|nr:hypothetical protein [Actinobaculum sp. 352]RTE50723.1 hypothetical protein EKN07_00825 [Actinobaculum sp. 352]